MPSRLRDFCRSRSLDDHAAARGNTPTAESCRAYSLVFLEAVNTRNVASICEDGADRQRDLALLDADIDAFNNLIAAHCSGS